MRRLLFVLFGAVVLTAAACTPPSSGGGTTNQAPIAAATAVPTSGYAPLSVAFSSAGSHDDGRSRPIHGISATEARSIPRRTPRTSTRPSGRTPPS